jgi:mRNA interferase RelE/StbE
MKPVRYTADAAKSLKRHGNVAPRVMKAINEYAADPLAHANRIKRLVGSTANRLSVSDFRVIFEETEDGIIVTKIGPRGNVYD